MGYVHLGLQFKALRTYPNSVTPTGRGQCGPTPWLDLAKNFAVIAHLHGLDRITRPWPGSSLEIAGENPFEGVGEFQDGVLKHTKGLTLQDGFLEQTQGLTGRATEPQESRTGITIQIPMSQTHRPLAASIPLAKVGPTPEMAGDLPDSVVLPGLPCGQRGAAQKQNIREAEPLLVGRRGTQTEANYVSRG